YDNLALNLSNQSKYAEAEPLCRQALALCRKVLGEDHPHTASSYNNAGVTLNAQGKYAEAELLFRQALVIRRKVLGEDHPDTASSHNSVAVALYLQGKYTEAETLWVEAAHSFELARWRSNRTGLERVSATVPPPYLSLAVCQARRRDPIKAWQSLETSLARGLLADLPPPPTPPLSPEKSRRL